MTADVLASCVRGGTAVFVLAVAVLGAGGDARAQAPGRTIWDGIYTQGQSERGRTIFVASCGRCHNGMYSMSTGG